MADENKDDESHTETEQDDYTNPDKPADTNIEDFQEMEIEFGEEAPPQVAN